MKKAVPKEKRSPRVLPSDKNIVPTKKIKSSKTPIEEELLYYGVHACHALFKNRREDIVRAYITNEHLKEFSPLLKWCAQNKRAYHIVLKEDISRVAESVHHEGIAILAKRKKDLTEKELLKQLKIKSDPIVVLAGVENPHNIGSIIRVMAHFGWKYLIYPQEQAIRLSSSAARIGEGGSEVVNITTVKNIAQFIKEIKPLGYQTIGTSAHARDSIYSSQITYPACAIFLGNEKTGLSPNISKMLDVSISIPSAGQVQSLNVGIAAALFIGECVRRHGVIL